MMAASSSKISNVDGDQFSSSEVIGMGDTGVNLNEVEVLLFKTFVAKATALDDAEFKPTKSEILLCNSLQAKTKADVDEDEDANTNANTNRNANKNVTTTSRDCEKLLTEGKVITAETLRDSEKIPAKGKATAALQREEDDEDRNAMQVLTCYHSSTAEKFADDSGFQDAVISYLKILDRTYPGELYVKNQLVSEPAFDLMLTNSEFGEYIFALCTELLKHDINNEGWESAAFGKGMALQKLVSLGIAIKYYWIPRAKEKDINPGSVYYRKKKKYEVDITTIRGLVNVLARETKPFCDCMKEEKSKAKTMQKVGLCFNCGDDFPKRQLLLCAGCLGAHFCSKKCQLQQWSSHKALCEKLDFKRCGDKDCTILLPKKQLMHANSSVHNDQYLCKECNISSYIEKRDKRLHLP